MSCKHSEFSEETVWRSE